MALQGDLDTFALPDVLRLLASGGKSGRLDVDGDRGRAVALLHNGGFVGGSVGAMPAATAPVDVMFELLRFEAGSFSFDGDSVVTGINEPVDVDRLLADARELLAEWRQVDPVLASLDVHVRLARELPAEEVTVGQDQWRLLAAMVGGASVRDLATRLGLTDLGISRTIRDLVGAGVVEIHDQPRSPGAAELADAALLRESPAARAGLDALAAALVPEARPDPAAAAIGVGVLDPAARPAPAGGGTTAEQRRALVRYLASAKP